MADRTCQRTDHASSTTVVLGFNTADLLGVGVGAGVSGWPPALPASLIGFGVGVVALEVAAVIGGARR